MSFYKWFDTYKLNKEQKYTHKDQMEDAWNAASEEIIKLIEDEKNIHKIECNKVANTLVDGQCKKTLKEIMLLTLGVVNEALTELKEKIKVG